MHSDLEHIRRTFAKDGAVKVPRALNAAALKDALTAYEWSLAHPGPGASRFAQTTNALFYQDLWNPDCVPNYRSMLLASPLSRLIAGVWGTPDVWFMYEQVFLKEGGESRRTPWHQDASYLAIGGSDLAVAWITFDALAKDDSLEFVRGSHKGALFNGSRFELGDDTAPLHPNSPLPRLPDIEAERTRYNIVSWAVEPGDVVLFHPATLHGGAPTHEGQKRRTLTLRYFGRNAHYDRRPGPSGPRIAGFHERMKQGDPFRDESFLKVL
jgi:ectoine hydroxylase-related dioxygenase (phytanoyl-CoA dioxygenase family)